MTFADWLEQSRASGVSKDEEAAAAAVHARLEAAKVIAEDLLAAPSEATVRAVFEQLARHV